MSMGNINSSESGVLLRDDAPARTPQDEAAAEKHEAGVLGTALNMSCNIMGGAVLVLPTAVQDTSVSLGIVLMVVLGLMSVSTMVMLSHAAERLKTYTYRTLLATVVHEKAGKFFEYALFLYTFGVLVEYGRIISDAMPDVSDNFFHVGSGVLRDGWFWLLLACIPFFLLTSLPRLTELKWSSFVGLLTIVYVEFLIFMRFVDGNYRELGRTSLIAEDVSYLKFDWNFFRAIPVLTVAFSCHYNIPVYYKELKTRNLKTFYKCILCVSPALIAVYNMCGVLGYLTFGDARMSKTTGNIVKAYGSDDTAVNVGRLGLFFHFCSVFPIVAIGCRNCLNGILFGSPLQPQKLYFIEAFCLVGVSAILAYVVPGIAFVIDVIGSLVGVSIVYIVPSLVYIGAFKGDDGDGLCDGRGSVSDGVGRNNSIVAVRGDSIAAVTPGSASHGGFAKDGREGSFAGGGADAGAQRDLGGVRKTLFLFRLAHVYIVFGVLASIISFTVTIYKVAHGES
jgi:amino acid permease